MCARHLQKICGKLGIPVCQGLQQKLECYLLTALQFHAYCGQGRVHSAETLLAVQGAGLPTRQGSNAEDKKKRGLINLMRFKFSAQ